MKRLIMTAFLFVFLPTVLFSQTVSALGGIGSSIKLGESALSPIFKSTIVFGDKRDKIRIEDSVTFTTANKLESGRGWGTGNNFDVIVFMKGQVFLDVGFDYLYRNGGDWVKKTGYYKLGGGIEWAPSQIETTQIRGVYRREIISGDSLNDITSYYFLWRVDSKISGSWFLRGEMAPGIIRYYTQDLNRQTGAFLNGYFGLVYKK